MPRFGRLKSQSETTQEVVTDIDGAISIGLATATSRGHVFERDIIITDNDTTGVDITLARTAYDDEVREHMVSIDEDVDEGVNISLDILNKDGVDVSILIEVDEAIDVFDFTTTISESGGDVTVTDSGLIWELILENVEELTVEAITEAYLEHHGVDLAGIDLSTISDFA